MKVRIVCIMALNKMNFVWKTPIFYLKTSKTLLHFFFFFFEKKKKKKNIPVFLLYFEEDLVDSLSSFAIYYLGIYQATKL